MVGAGHGGSAGAPTLASAICLPENAEGWCKGPAMLRALSALAFVLSISATAHAGDRFEIGAYGGYLFGGSVNGESPTVTSTADATSAA